MFTRPAASYPTLLLPLLLVATLLALAATPAAAAEPAAEPGDEEQAEPAPVGVKLGDFRIRDSRATEGIKVRLSFTLFTSVPEDEAEAFRQKLEARRGRLGDAVLVAVRIALPEEFEEPNLARLRRRIQLQVRRGLPGLPINELYVSDFSYLIE
ncbi:hypothetical protein [Pseudobythopirellula maris]|nr:hypothetical protein [Pseudobythopirellula maris]